MSGCRKTSRIGTSAEPERRPVVRHSSSRFARSARNAARKRTKSSLPNSDGWKRKKPRSIQRREPRAASPTRMTNTIAPVITRRRTTCGGGRCRGRRRGRRRRRSSRAARRPLPHEVVARVAGDVVARDPVDRPEPDADERGDGSEQQPVEVARTRRRAPSRSLAHGRRRATAGCRRTRPSVRVRCRRTCGAAP